MLLTWILTSIMLQYVAIIPMMLFGAFTTKKELIIWLIPFSYIFIIVLYIYTAIKELK